jgi:hypothetical protein
VGYALTLAIDGHPPALNGEQGLIRLHYRSYAQKRTEWETLILADLQLTGCVRRGGGGGLGNPQNSPFFHLFSFGG